MGDKSPNVHSVTAEAERSRECKAANRLGNWALGGSIASFLVGGFYVGIGTLTLSVCAIQGARRVAVSPWKGLVGVLLTIMRLLVLLALEGRAPLQPR